MMCGCWPGGRWRADGGRRSELGRQRWPGETGAHWSAQRGQSGGQDQGAFLLPLGVEGRTERSQSRRHLGEVVRDTWPPHRPLPAPPLGARGPSSLQPVTVEGTSGTVTCCTPARRHPPTAGHQGLQPPAYCPPGFLPLWPPAPSLQSLASSPLASCPPTSAPGLKPPSLQPLWPSAPSLSPPASSPQPPVPGLQSPDLLPPSLSPPDTHTRCGSC